MIAPRTTLQSRALACRTEQYYVPKIHTVRSRCAGGRHHLFALPESLQDARLDRTGGHEDGAATPFANTASRRKWVVALPCRPKSAVDLAASARTKAFSIVQVVAGVNSQHPPASIERRDLC
ncbi:hypothetical protein C8R45DRAFT_1069617 [Mycena sanguinolenta]|nr:hypothetical protein C8R45DRAFT_1069617 [Mycena sanguinolenta]